ncbi:MAG TPA: hypothetical protein EYP35_02570 [Desulfobacterales bacterium]|nr:hypothetical protein [Desulfobacterales bacterium]HIP38795.1 hypothetical protein [Desulfocapsa sulfexigens]
MPPSHSPVDVAFSAITEEIDLGLPKLPEPFDLQPLFPGDRLLRFHPNWFITDFKQTETSFTVSIKDYVTDEEFPLTGSFIFNSTDQELLKIQLSGTININISFLKRNNRFKVQISTLEKELDPNDPLLLWVRAIKEYVRIYIKRTPATLFFRILMNKMILKMDPSQRKICLMMAKITAVELLVIILVVIGYVNFVL